MTFPFFFNDTALTEIYTLSLHDALPISGHGQVLPAIQERRRSAARCHREDRREHVAGGDDRESGKGLRRAQHDEEETGREESACEEKVTAPPHPPSAPSPPSGGEGSRLKSVARP